jgi:hypothetical protein
VEARTARREAQVAGGTAAPPPFNEIFMTNERK